MALTQYYVDPAIAGDSGTGTIGDPYGDLQYALNQITRDSTNGDQINIKAGTAEVLAASLTLATYGTPTAGVPLVLRGYTSAANDGGRGAISGGGSYTIWAVNTLDFIACIDMDFSNAGNNNLFYLDDWITLINCSFDKGASSPSSKWLCVVGDYCQVIGCKFGAAGTSGTSLQVAGAGLIYGNYATALISPNGLGGVVFNNIINLAEIGASAITTGGGSQPMYIFGNIIYQGQAGTGAGISIGSVINTVVLNNIICGFSGVGGKGISKTGDAAAIGYNAFYNCATNESYSGDILNDMSNDVALAADPFTDAASGDFSLTAAAKTALAAKGFPTSYLGAHANTVSNLNIGPIQMAASSGGGGVNMPRVRVGH